MTTLLALSCALLTGALSGTAQAEEAKPTRFSLGLGVGIRPDMAQLGTTIVQDGTVDVSDSSLAGYYSTDKFLMSDRNNMTLQANSEGTSSIFNMQSDYQAGGSMLGLEKGGDLRYELDDVIKFPLFISAGFYHTGKLSGGEQSRTMGDVVPNLPDLYINVIENITGNSAEDYAGGTMKTTWNASWWEIPISLGMKVPIKPHWYVYGKAGSPSSMVASTSPSTSTKSTPMCSAPMWMRPPSKAPTSPPMAACRTPSPSAPVPWA